MITGVPDWVVGIVIALVVVGICVYIFRRKDWR
jgi:uncharacterized membrane protein YqiK